jgi:bifunctional non-homologous end joining protein LigD
MAKLVQKQGWERVDAKPASASKNIKVEGKNVEFKDYDLEYWPEITKHDVWKYYEKIFSWIAPYLKDRALGLNVSLGSPGQEDDEEFIRSMEGRAPKWATVFHTDRKHPKPGKSSKIDWLVCNDRPTLAYIISLGCIDLHPWTSRITSPNFPDYIVIDLDPSDGDFRKAVETAKAAKKFLDKTKLTAFIKTSGKTGIHIYIPCNKIEFGEARNIALHICSEIHNQVPDFTTMETRKEKRGDKLYIDPSQNDFADRVACVYSLRAFSEPNVSTPIEWKELNNKLRPSDFNLETIEGRLKKTGDLFQRVCDEKIASNNSIVLAAFI